MKTEDRNRTWASVGLVLAVAALLGLSVLRLVGAWRQPLFPSQLAWLGAIWALLGGMWRHWARSLSWTQGEKGWLVALGLSCWLGLLVSQPGSPPVALVLFWVWILGVQAAWWSWWEGASWKRGAVPSASSAIAESVSGLATGFAESATEKPAANQRSSNEESTAQTTEEESGIWAAIADPRVMQAWQARRVGDQEQWSGWVRVHWGDQAAQEIQVAFCPPLPSVPQVHCEAVEGVGAEVEAVRVFPHGVRLRVRREDSSVPASGWTIVAVEAVASLAQHKVA